MTNVLDPTVTDKSRAHWNNTMDAFEDSEEDPASTLKGWGSPERLYIEGNI